MPRVKIGPAVADRKTIDVEIARLRDLDIDALRARWHAQFGRRPPPTSPAICCFAFWLTGSKLTIGATLMPRAGGCSIAQGHPRTPDSALLTSVAPLRTCGLARCWAANGTGRCSGWRC
jgi:hypothetical protein